MAQFSLNTPWGRAQHVTELGDGLRSVSTAGHGGIFVPEELLSQIPEKWRKAAMRWSRSEQWYEEDCCWAYVAVALPQYFSAEQVEAARRTMEAFPPK